MSGAGGRGVREGDDCVRKCAAAVYGGVPNAEKISRPRFLMLWVMAGTWGAPLIAQETASLPARVILVVNASDPESARVAQHYAQARHVPEKNIYAFAMPCTEEISRAEFVRLVWQPLQDALVGDRWIDGIPLGTTTVGRRRQYAMNGHRISALVVCRGVPLKIHDGTASEVSNLPAVPAPPLELRTRAAAVDSEFALLAANYYPELGTVTNVLFQKVNPGTLERDQVVTVGRLDGPTFEAANQLVDNACTAERDGISGRAYIDLSGRHADGDRWLGLAGKALLSAGFETDIDHASTTMNLGARADAPIFYFGWYTENLDGPFSLPGFRFPVGAVALHIHSFSAHTLRSTTAGWSGPLVEHGATITFGNVYEPFLHLTVRPDLFVRALLSGKSAGEAYVFSMPVWSWQGVFLGDPLYRPFARDFNDLWAHRRDLPAETRAYLDLEKIHRAQEARDFVLAQNVAETSWREEPTLALAVSLGERAGAAHDWPRAVAYMRAAVNFPIPDSSAWGLAHRATQFLAQHGQPESAKKIYDKLFALPLPRELRALWLGEGAGMLQATDSATATRWTLERDGPSRPAK